MNKSLVAFFLPSVRGGGAERMMLNLASGFRDRGLNVDMVLAKAGGHYLREIPPEINVVDLGASRVLTSLPLLIRYLRRHRPAGLIAALAHANIVAILASELARVDTKVVVSIRSTMSMTSANTSRLKYKIILALIKIFYPRAHAVVAVSKGAADDMAKITGFDRDRIKVIYNAVITPHFKNKIKKDVEHKWFATKDRPVLIAVGRLTAPKDFPSLLKAFTRVLEQRRAYLIILGEGEERNSLEDLIAELNLEDDVDMPGFVDNPYKYMAKADVFVLSSAWEGLPGVLIEALATGTPVVATDCPSGPREILQAGRIGRLTPVGNWEMLAEAIIATLDEPRKKIDPKDLKPFTQKKAVDAYLNLLRIQS